MGYFYIAHHMSVDNVGYAGVAIFSRIRFTKFGEGVGDNVLDSEGRLVWVEFDQFRLYNVYAPNSGSTGNMSSDSNFYKPLLGLITCLLSLL